MQLVVVGGPERNLRCPYASGARSAAFSGRIIGRAAANTGAAVLRGLRS